MNVGFYSGWILHKPYDKMVFYHILDFISDATVSRSVNLQKRYENCAFMGTSKVFVSFSSFILTSRSSIFLNTQIKKNSHPLEF